MNICRLLLASLVLCLLNRDTGASTGLLVERKVLATTVCECNGNPKLLAFEEEKYRRPAYGAQPGLVHYKVQRYDASTGLDKLVFERTIWQSSDTWSAGLSVDPIVGLVTDLYGSFVYIGIAVSPLHPVVTLFRVSIEGSILEPLDSFDGKDGIEYVPEEKKTNPLATMPLDFRTEGQCANSLPEGLSLAADSDGLTIFIAKLDSQCNVSYRFNPITSSWNYFDMKERPPTEDPFGIPPTGKFVSPYDGDNIILGGERYLRVRIDVHDDVRVKSVELFLDDKVVSAKEPIEKPEVSMGLDLPEDFFDAPPRWRSISLRAKVADIGGNSATIGPVQVRIYSPPENENEKH